MTQEYLVGETSMLLALLESAAPDAVCAAEVERLRCEAEQTPPAGLSQVAARALRLADRLCWESLDRGDVEAFGRQCACETALRDFCVVAQLFSDQ
ncbi:hypothetical protein [Streptacidiphilus sp. MAP5-52]|uniref:hypothetical protein n=1 Tax=Streptacidiphilus sp. MAP5-52 TaxID=3156267 RepID=UPI0035196F91